MTLDLGGVRVDVISDGTFALDGGAMFGVVPKPLWARVHPPDDRNRITLALNCLLIRRDDHCVLVDTGMGHFWTDKERDIFAVRNEPGLLEALRDLGVAPGDVTTVINTHLHFDHAGATRRSTMGNECPLSRTRSTSSSRASLSGRTSPRAAIAPAIGRRRSVPFRRRGVSAS